MDPCCGASNQTGVKIIAILKLVLSILVLAYGIFLCVGAAGIKDMAAEHKLQSSASKLSPRDLERIEVEANAVTIASVIVIFSGLINLLFSVLLLVGVNKRNRTMCMVYFVVNIIVLCLYTVDSVWKVSTVGLSGRFVGNVFGIIVEGFFSWVLWEFIKELKDSGNKGSYRV